MNSLKLVLVSLEKRLQGWIEGGAARLFPGQQAFQTLALQFGQAVQEGLRPSANGSALAPNLYVLLLPAEQARILQDSPMLRHELASNLRLAVEEAGWRFSTPPMVRVAVAPELAPGQIRVLAQHSLDNLSQTTGMQVVHPGQRAMPRTAFLVVDGTRIFSLSKTIVNIGRSAENQLIIDDPRVSRLHAQLRLVNGRYRIFDLDSRGGTWVNGKRVRQHTLFPGDVVSLAGVPLVYGQDADQEDTQDMPVAD
ncbi:MAG: FhaA domain-containing protein [Chloroflexota bacterium]